MMEKLYSILSR